MLPPLKMPKRRQLIGNDITLARDVVNFGCSGDSTTGHHSRKYLGQLLLPTAHRYTEACLLLLLRDEGQVAEFFWSAMLTYISEYVQPTGLLRTEALADHHRQFFEEIQSGDKPMAQIIEDLKASLH